MNTAERVLDKLRAYNLKQDSPNQYRCNRPWISGSDSMGLSIKIDGPEHGAFYDHVSNAYGSLYELANRLGIQISQDVSKPNVPIRYDNITQYAEAHGVPPEVFEAAKWEETTCQGRPALKYPTKAGYRYRLLDGKSPKYKSTVGYQPCWYALDLAIKTAREKGKPLYLCNGEPSVLVALHFGIPACAVTSGEKKSIPIPLLRELVEKWDGEIIIAPDCDETGLTMVFGNHKNPGQLQQLSEVGYKIQAVDLGLEDGQDIADFCKIHGEKSLETLLALPELLPPSAGRFQVHWAEEALQPQPPIDWRIVNLIPDGTVSILYGDPGAKKTWSALDLAVCVATGNDWLNFETNPGNVLIVDEESGLRWLNRRLGDAIRGHLVEDVPPPIAYTSLEGLNLTDDIHVHYFHNIIVETGAKMIIIDAMADIMPGADENSVKDVHPVFMALRKIAEDTQSAIIIIHHTNRSGGYRGSSAMEGAVDLMLMVESKQGSPNIDFETKKARHIEPLKFGATAHWVEEPDAEGQFYLEASTPTEKSRTFSKSKKFVLKFLRDNGEQPIPMIMSHAEICSPESARRAVYDLANLGLVERTNTGEMGQGVQAIYSLTEEGRVEAGKLI